MKPKRFELTKEKNFTKKEKIIAFLGAFNYLPFLIYKIHEGEALSLITISVTGLLIVLVGLSFWMKINYSKIEAFKTYVDFSNDLLKFKLSNFKKENVVDYQSLQSVFINKSEVRLVTPTDTFKLKLSMFSTKEIHRIKLYFKSLRDELAIS